MSRTVRTLPLGATSDVAPVIVHRAPRPGPTAVVTANVHGDEFGGVYAVHTLDRWLSDALERGRVVLHPTLNPSGLAAGTRNLSGDAGDLNRWFPGNESGSPPERVAAAIWNHLLSFGPAVVVDLHSDTAHGVPYVIVDRRLDGDPDGLEVAVRALARATGLTVLGEYPDERYQRYGLDRSLAGAMVNRAGVEAFTLEVGPRRVRDAAAVECMVAAIRGVLGHLGLVEGHTADHPSLVPGDWQRGFPPRASATGLFHPLVEPGQTFAAGTPLAGLRSIEGRNLGVVRAAEDGLALSWVDAGWVRAGTLLGSIAVRVR